MDTLTPVRQTLHTAVHEAGVAQVGEAGLAPWPAHFLRNTMPSTTEGHCCRTTWWEDQDPGTP